MPNIGPLELIIILAIALLIIGPGKLPDVGAALGKSIREFRKASADVQDAVKVDTSPLPATPPAPVVPAPIAQVEAPPAPPAATATSADVPGTPTVASTPTASVPSSEPTPGTN